MMSWGEIYGGPDPAYVTSEGVEVWMHRKGQRVRFFTAEGEQVGPEHRNVVPAVIWAANEAWVDPFNPILSLAVTMEVRSNSHSARDRFEANRKQYAGIEARLAET